MDKIQDDLKEMELDVEQIDCHPIVKFFLDCMKCGQDTIAYCFKPKTNNLDKEASGSITSSEEILKAVSSKHTIYARTINDLIKDVLKNPIQSR
jgi:hypothetical protein